MYGLLPNPSPCRSCEDSLPNIAYLRTGYSENPGQNERTPSHTDNPGAQLQATYKLFPCRSPYQAQVLTMAPCRTTRDGPKAMRAHKQVFPNQKAHAMPKALGVHHLADPWICRATLKH
ncbi:hypothetical protein GBA52_010402 [Prunus armeniaca]|nr:hypothetical protein GBA52_010402 [Prunus armeniaca]